MRKILLLTLFTIIVLASSCEKEIPATLTLSVGTVDIANYDGAVSFNVTSNNTWTVSTTESWLTFSKTTGSGDGSVTISAANNFTSTSRSATVKVTCKELVRTITVTQTNSLLTTDVVELSYQKEAGSKSVIITSNTKWDIQIPSNTPWITSNTLTGVGNGQILLTVQENTAQSVRNATITILYATANRTVIVTQRGAGNNLPTAPTLTLPENNSTNIGTIPVFSWGASTDADGDAISYKFQYSTDNVSWKDTVVTGTQLFFAKNLDPNTKYYWKVSSYDTHEYNTSQVNNFTTGAINAYNNGQYIVSQTNSSGTAPCEILFLGDGYTAPDYTFGGVYDTDVTNGIEAFFSVEPYKTYKNYFKVYKMAAYSAESGITQIDRSITKQTCFSSIFAGGSSITTDYTVVYNYAKKMTGVDDNKLKTMLIILVLNQDRYAGTCFMWSDGRAIAICPVSKSASSATSKFAAIVNHEAGGHGWAGLGDEYITSANAGKTIPAADVTSYQSWAAQGFNANVDVTGVAADVKWKHFIGASGYERVSTFEGALYYTYGAWRAENTSCMINNIPYYSAPSREAAVKKIMRVSGGTYSLETFIQNDIIKSPTVDASFMTKSFNPLTFVPLGAPIRIK